MYKFESGQPIRAYRGFKSDRLLGALKLGKVEIFDDIGDVAGQVMLGQSVLQSCTEGGEGLAIPVYWLESGHERGEVRDGSDFIRPGSGR